MHHPTRRRPSIQLVHPIPQPFPIDLTLPDLLKQGIPLLRLPLHLLQRLIQLRLEIHQLPILLVQLAEEESRAIFGRVDEKETGFEIAEGLVASGCFLFETFDGRGEACVGLVGCG